MPHGCLPDPGSSRAAGEPRRRHGAGIQLVFLVVLLGAAWANFMTRDVSN
jgi:hypothetical protein